MSDPYRWRGFAAPAYTQIPDEFFDELMTQLNEAELRVLLYLMRRTFGFKKERDNVSFRQLIDGITTADGKVLDHGTGMKKTSVLRGIKGLVEKQVIFVERQVLPGVGNIANSYRVRLVGDPVDEIDVTKQEPVSDPGTAGGTPLVPLEEPPLYPQRSTPSIRQRHKPLYRQRHPQKRVEQETEEQETVRSLEASNGRSPRIEFDGDRAELTRYVQDFAREFGDEANIRSSLTRTVNLYRRSGLTLDDFVNVLYAARAKTQEWSASITTKATAGRPGANQKNKMPYFFSIVEDMLGLRPERPMIVGNER